EGMISQIAFAGLIVFSVFESLSSLGKMQTSRAADLPATAILEFGPWVYSVLMVVTCILSMFIYLRARLAAGSFWLKTDPTDQPFRLLLLTYSLLCYSVLSFLFVVSLHILLTLAIPIVEQGIVLAIDGLSFFLALLGEQMMLAVVGRKLQRSPHAPRE